MTLIEMLVSLVVIGGLMAALSGVFSQAMGISARQDRVTQQADDHTVSFGFLGARLQAIALVGQPGRPRQPMFRLTRDELQFVTRLLPPAPDPGLYLVSVRATGGALRLTLTDWPDQRRTLDATLPGREVQFAAQGDGAVVPGLPLAVLVTIDGITRRLSLGAQMPADCVLPLGDTAGRGGPVLCPGVTN